MNKNNRISNWGLFLQNKKNKKAQGTEIFQSFNLYMMDKILKE
jgi:hypothetical protein